MRRRRLASRRRMAAAFLGAMSIGAGCGDAEAPRPLRAELEEGVVARVGDVAISEDTVERIARAQALSPTDALNVAIGDALFEAELRQRGVFDPASAAFDSSLQRRARA